MEELLANAAVFPLYGAVMKQLASAQGVLGYSLLAGPLRKQFLDALRVAERTGALSLRTAPIAYVLWRH